MAILQASHYGETVTKLKADPILQAMAADVDKADMPTLCHDGDPGSPKGPFMMASLREYQRRGGEIESHIGGVSEAILALVDARVEGPVVLLIQETGRDFWTVKAVQGDTELGSWGAEHGDIALSCAIGGMLEQGKRTFTVVNTPAEGETGSCPRCGPAGWEPNRTREPGSCPICKGTGSIVGKAPA